MRAEMSKTPSRAPSSELYLPAGFRFCPTDEELVVQYLSKKAALQPFSVPIIAEIELYKFDPWDLPDKALFGEKEWYFFSPRDRKYPNGSRPNRAAGSGYWKATGTDKPISSLSGIKKVGVKKALVFYSGKAPKGVKTNWIMHEYRLAESAPRPGKRKESLRMDDWVLCRIYKKSSSVPKPAKECSDDDSSSLEELLDSFPAMDQSKLASNISGLHSQNESVAKQQFLITSKSFYEEAQIKSEPTGMAGVDDEKMSQADGAVQADLFLRDLGCGNRVCEESSQGASSELLDSFPALDQSKLAFNIPRLHLRQESVAKQQFLSYEEGHIKSEPSEMAGVEDEKMSQAEGAVQTELFLRDFGRGNKGCEESSQGAASSLELSYLSHENSRQQYSPPDSKPEDDSVESTFSSLQSFPSTDRNFDRNFAHPYFNFDSLPSPNLGRFETLSAFSDVDIFSFGL